MQLDKETPMFEVTYAQLRFAASIVFGIPFDLRSLDRLIDGLVATQQEFGTIGAEAAELLGGAALDEETRREVQLRRFRTQASQATRETVYYRRLFEGLGLDPAHLSFKDIRRIPVTSKETVRDNPDAFVCRSARPVFRTTTTGTTGRPTNICFSAQEMRTYIALTAIGLLTRQLIGPEDIVQINTSSRATLGNTCFTGACARLGALVYPVGLVEPEHTLALLAEKHCLPGKKSQTSVLSVYPSYLGELVERGLRLGYQPGDFGLERIAVGGELVTAGLKARCRELFGPVEFSEGYGMTEPWPFGGTVCAEGHLHFEIAHGLLEVLNPRIWAPALPGEVGSLVLTPFPPFRQTTLLLRYDTQDMVRPVSGALTCSLRHLPATSNLLGKRRLSVQHDQGWTYPRQVMEALEAVEAVPLPARFGFWAVPNGIAVEVVVRRNTAAIRRQLEQSLAEWDVPIQELHLLADRSQLRRPFPLRGDLREGTFASLPAPQAQPDGNGTPLLISTFPGLPARAG
jgi:phenylacetate-coenzyme A ligase PaaK-like adenylate-forming protein